MLGQVQKCGDSRCDTAQIDRSTLVVIAGASEASSGELSDHLGCEFVRRASINPAMLLEALGSELLLEPWM